MSDNRAAWADFWQTGASGGACLPQALHDIEDAQRNLWQGLARTLRKGASVLDLATGDGAVLRKMREVRRDLKLTGVDSSPSLPPAPSGIRLIAGAAVEELPFPDRHFDAVTSQFGIEYGDTQAASGEIARVLRSGGQARFVIHRRDGPILAHNLSRREALDWALNSGWLDKAHSLAAARRLSALPTPPTFRAAVDEANRAFPQQPVAAEFLLAIVQSLELGRRRPPDQTLEVLHTLESKARNEIARIATLERAACDERQLGRIADQMRAAGLQVAEPDVLKERRNDRPFAWVLSADRA